MQSTHLRPSPDHAERLTALEDFGAQNQFSAIGYVKPGSFRRLTIRAVLARREHEFKDYLRRDRCWTHRPIRTGSFPRRRRASESVTSAAGEATWCCAS